MHGKKNNILLKWIIRKIDSNFYERKESCHKTIQVRKQQQNEITNLLSENMAHAY